MITAYTRLDEGDVNAPANMQLARVDSVEHDRVIFWLVAENRHVEMPIGDASRGDFMVGASRMFAVLVGEEVTA